MTVRTFTLRPDSIPYESIVEDWKILCGAWKFLGEKTVHAASIGPKDKDDYNVVKRLREALEGVDVIVHHNGDRFDVKKLNARLIYHKLPPLPLIPTVDTLKEVRKIAAFTSNRLDYLGLHLLGEGKMKIESSIWRDVLDGKASALQKMVKYNKMDVVVLEKLYLRLRPYMKSHPHIGAMRGERISCPKCGSTKLKKNGTRFTAAGLKKQEIQCLSCYSYSKIPIK